MKKYNIIILSIFLISMLFTSIVSADPTVDSITTDPVKPKPLSTFTIIVDISGVNIEEVKVTVTECTDGPPETTCFVSHTNLAMTLNNDGKYETQVSLTGTQDSIDHVQYVYYITDDGVEYTLTEDFRTDLDVSNGQNNGVGGSNSSPGFELILLIIAIIVGLIIIRKKE